MEFSTRLGLLCWTMVPIMIHLWTIWKVLSLILVIGLMLVSKDYRNFPYSLMLILVSFSFTNTCGKIEFLELARTTSI